LFGSLFTRRGADVVYNQANIETNTSDYSPFAQAMIAAKPDIIYTNTTLPPALALSAALKQGGYKGVIANFVGYLPGQLAKQPNVAAALDGTYVDVQYPPGEASSPAISQFKADLKAINQPQVIDIGDSLGYWQADVLIAMMKAAGSNLTGASLQQAVNSGTFKYTPSLSGGIGAMSFPDAENVASPCAALVKVVKTSYEVAVPFQCYQNIPAS